MNVSYLKLDFSKRLILNDYINEVTELSIIDFIFSKNPKAPSGWAHRLILIFLLSLYYYFDQSFSKKNPSFSSKISKFFHFFLDSGLLHVYEKKDI